MKQLCIGLCNFACDGMSCVVVVRWTVALIRCHGYTCRINRTSSSLTPFHMLEGPSVSLSLVVVVVVVYRRSLKPLLFTTTTAPAGEIPQETRETLLIDFLFHHSTLPTLKNFLSPNNKTLTPSFKLKLIWNLYLKMITKSSYIIA